MGKLSYQEVITQSYSSEEELFDIIEATTTKYGNLCNEHFRNLINSDMKSYTDSIAPATYKLCIETDASGNNTKKEYIVYQDGMPSAYAYDVDGWYAYKPMENMKLEYVYPYEGAQGTTNCSQIYDSWYGGYCERDSYGDKYFITRLNESTVFKLDEVGTKNIPVDEKESLFDKKHYN